MGVGVMLREPRSLKPPCVQQSSAVVLMYFRSDRDRNRPVLIGRRHRTVTPIREVRKNGESDPSEAKRNRLGAKRDDICGNSTL